MLTNRKYLKNVLEKQKERENKEVKPGDIYPAA